MKTTTPIVLTPTKLDNYLELACKFIFFIMWALTLYTFLKLPLIIPTHFNGLGLPDSFGDKRNILILPVIATLIYFGISKLNKHPNLFNKMSNPTAEDIQRQYVFGTQSLRFVKLGALMLISLDILFTYLTTIGVVKGMGSWAVPFTLVIMLVPQIVLIWKSLK